MTPKELMDMEEERYAAECSAIHDQLEGMKGIGR